MRFAKVFKPFFVTLFSFTIAACSTVTGYPETDKTLLPTAINSTYLITEAEYTGTTDQEKRNKLIQGKLRDIDNAYGQFEMSLYKEGIISDLASDWTLLGLAGATTVAGGANTKEVLGAISAFILGSKASFDKRALLENTMSVIVQKMRAERAKVMIDILRGMGSDTSTYPIEAGAIDLSRYYFAGTVPAALSGLAKTAAIEEEEAIEEQEEVREFQFTSDAAEKCLNEFWKPGGTINATNQTAIQTWINGSPYAGITPLSFFFSAEAAQARIDAVNHFIGTGDISSCAL